MCRRCRLCPLMSESQFQSESPSPKIPESALECGQKVSGAEKGPEGQRNYPHTRAYIGHAQLTLTLFSRIIMWFPACVLLVPVPVSPSRSNLITSPTGSSPKLITIKSFGADFGKAGAPWPIKWKFMGHTWATARGKCVCLRFPSLINWPRLIL